MQKMAPKRDIRVKKIIFPGLIYFYLILNTNSVAFKICLNLCKEKLLGDILLPLPFCVNLEYVRFDQDAGLDWRQFLKENYTIGL